MGQLAMKLISSILDEGLKSGEGSDDAPTIMFVCGGKKKEDVSASGEGGAKKEEEGASASSKTVCSGCILDSLLSKCGFDVMRYHKKDCNAEGEQKYELLFKSSDTVSVVLEKFRERDLCVTDYEMLKPGMYRVRYTCNIAA